MAAGTKSDMKIYEEQYFTGMTEVLEQEANVFNAASNNAIKLVARNMMGDFGKESFIKSAAALVSRRDITSVAAAADTGVTAGEAVTVKCNRKIGPAAMTLDSFKKVGSDEATFYYLLGRQDAKAVIVDYLNTVIAAGVACFKLTTDLVYDVTVGKPGSTAAYQCSHTNLIKTLAKFGDAGGKIVAWLMHSRQYYDLALNAVTDKITNVADAFIVTGSNVSLNRPIIVTDSTSLIVAGVGSSKKKYEEYFVMGLVEEGLQATQSEDRVLLTEFVTGYENILMRYQGESAFNVGVKGHSYKTGSGANPTLATLAASANWEKNASDNRSCHGVALRCQWSSD